MGKVFPKTEPGPIRLLDAEESPDGRPQWILTRYDDIVAALSDARLTPRGRTYPSDCAAAQLLVREQKQPADWVGDSMIAMDPPDHTRLRKLAVRYFSAKNVEALRPRLQEIADELLDAIVAREDQQVDLVKAYAFPFFVRVFCELLNVPEPIRKQLLPDEIVKPIIPVEVGYTAVVELIEQRRAEPADDMMTTLIAAHDEGTLSYDELVAMPLLLLFGGITTVPLIGNGVMTLLQHADQLAQLRDDPALVSSTVDEILRYVSPTVLLSRFTTEDVEIGGTTIPSGSHVRMVVGSAGHDPARFDDPERFDIHRNDGHALAFGHGIHYCLGALLAKLEGEVAIGAVIRRFPHLSMTESVTVTEVEPAGEVGGGIAGLERLHVRLYDGSPSGV
jgi:cytochrome P450